MYYDGVTPVIVFYVCHEVMNQLYLTNGSCTEK